MCNCTIHLSLAYPVFPSIYSLSRVYEHKANNKLLQTRTAATPRQPPLSYHERVSRWRRQAASISSLSGLSLSLTLQGCSLILATRILPRSSLCRPSVRCWCSIVREREEKARERKRGHRTDPRSALAACERCRLSDRHTGQPGLEGAGARSLALLGYQNRLRARGATPLYTLAPSPSLPRGRERRGTEGGRQCFLGFTLLCSALGGRLGGREEGKRRGETSSGRSDPRKDGWSERKGGVTDDATVGSTFRLSFAH